MKPRLQLVQSKGGDAAKPIVGRPNGKTAPNGASVGRTTADEIDVQDISHFQFRPLPELDLEFDPSYRALWCLQRHTQRPTFTHQLLKDIASVQQSLKDGFDMAGAADGGIRYLVWASQKRNIFNLGGDLIHFVHLLGERDRDGMRRYAKACIDVCHANHVNLDLPITTVALVKGDALGGGLESALSSDIIVAERRAQFGFPEILFGLYPGMGAYSLASRRIGTSAAERMIFSGRIYSAQELYEMGLVDVLAEDGEGEEALHAFLKRHDKRFEAHRALYEIRRRVKPVTYEEMAAIAERWVETALTLGRLDLRKMQRLAKAQIERMNRDETAEDAVMPAAAAGGAVQGVSPGTSLAMDGSQPPPSGRQAVPTPSTVAPASSSVSSSASSSASTSEPARSSEPAAKRTGPPADKTDQTDQTGDADTHGHVLSQAKDQTIVTVQAGTHSVRHDEHASAASATQDRDVYNLILEGVAEHRAAATLQPGVERLLSEGMDRDEYLEFTEQLYHVVWHFCPTMAAAASRCGDDYRDLRYALYHNIDDEKGHETWVLDDIAALGGDVDAVRRGKPAVPMQAMIGYNYHVAERGNPWGVLGMVHVLEEISMNYSSRVAKVVAERLGITDGSGFKFLSSHGTMDVQHVDSFRHLVNTIRRKEDYEAIIDAAQVNYALFGALFRHA